LESNISLFLSYTVSLGWTLGVELIFFSEFGKKAIESRASKGNMLAIVEGMILFANAASCSTHVFSYLSSDGKAEKRM
jgi:hypothetical protein